MTDAVVTGAEGRGRCQRVDAWGHTAWSSTWADERLVDATLRLPDGATIVLRARTESHVLLGVCDAVHVVEGDGLGPCVARIAAVSWSKPTCIPAVDVPGALPTGAGAAILDLLATFAARAGVTSLRYRGPYPTAGLFAALHGSFRVASGTLDDFVADPDRRFGLADLSPAVDFVPAPFEWSWPAPRICAQHRGGLERLWIDGRAFDRDGDHHVLVDVGDHHRAQVMFAGASWCDVLDVDPDGSPRGPIAAPPAVDPELVGLALPQAMVDVVAEGLAQESAPALRSAILRVLGCGITLGDTGFAPARLEPSGVVAHAALVERALSSSPAASLRAVIDAVRTPVVRAAVADLAARVVAP